MTGLRYRKRIAVIPRHLFLNISRSASRGWTFSWSVRAFGITYNLNRKRTTADLPGGLYYEANGKRKHRKGGPGAAKAPTPPPPYVPARWPYAVLAILTVLAVIGGAVWQPILLFGVIALVVFLVQRGRSRRAGTPANRDAVTPAPEPEPGPDAAEAERIVREWNPPAGWERGA